MIIKCERHYTVIPNMCNLSSEADLQKYTLSFPQPVSDTHYTEMLCRLIEMILSILTCTNFHIQSCLQSFQTHFSFSQTIQTHYNFSYFSYFSSDGGQTPACSRSRRTCILTTHQPSPAPSTVALLVVTNEKIKRIHQQ